MKQVHNVRLRAIDRDREIITAIFERFLNDAGIDVKQAQLTIDHDGESDDPLYIGQLWLDRQQPIRKAIALLISNLPADERAAIQQRPEQFIDMATHCFFRLDKDGMQRGELRFSTAESTVQVRLNLAAFPAKKEVAANVLRQLFTG